MIPNAEYKLQVKSLTRGYVMKKSISLTIISILTILAIALGILYITNSSTQTRQIEALKTDVLEKTDTIDALNTEITEKAETINALKAEVAEKDGTIETLNADVTEKAGAIEALNADVTEKAGTIEALNADVAEKAGTIETLNADITEKAATIETLNADVTEKAATIETQAADIIEKATTIEALNADIAEKAKTIETQSANITEKAATIEALNAEIADKNTTIETLDAELATKANSKKTARISIIDINNLISEKNESTEFRAMMEDSAGLIQQNEMYSVMKSMIPITEHCNIAFITYPEDGDNELRSTAKAHSWGNMIFHDSTPYIVCAIDMKKRNIAIYSSDTSKLLTTEKMNSITEQVYVYAQNGEYNICASKMLELILSELNKNKI